MPGTRAVAPRPASRTCQSFCSSQRSSNTLVLGAPSLEPMSAANALARGVGLVLVVSAELDEQERVARRQEIHVARMQALPAHELHELRVDPLEPDRSVFTDLWHVIRRGVCVRVAEDDECAGRHGLDEAERRPEHHHACPFGSDERLTNVEAVLGQQTIEIETRHSPGEVGVPRPDRVLVPVA